MSHCMLDTTVSCAKTAELSRKLGTSRLGCRFKEPVQIHDGKEQFRENDVGIFPHADDQRSDWPAALHSQTSH